MIRKYIPNSITSLNLLSGCVAVMLAFSPQVTALGLTSRQLAYLAIGLAAVFDFADGFSARLLKAYSPMGKELDSLSDLVSFGLAPAFLVMNAILDAGHGIVAALPSLFIALCGALRLAKFNVDTRQTTSFIGLPIPANAIFWIGALAWCSAHCFPPLWVMYLLIAAMGVLMVCELPMFSLKFADWSFSANVRRYAILLAAVLFVLTSGLEGLAWTIVLYILISLFGRKNNVE